MIYNCATWCDSKDRLKLVLEHLPSRFGRRQVNWHCVLCSLNLRRRWISDAEYQAAIRKAVEPRAYESRQISRGLKMSSADPVRCRFSPLWVSGKTGTLQRSQTRHGVVIESILTDGHFRLSLFHRSNSDVDPPEFIHRIQLYYQLHDARCRPR